MPGKELRISEFLRPEDHKALILELDRGLMVGPVQGLYKLEEVLDKVHGVDAVVLTLGQIKRVYRKLKGRDAPAAIIRADWTNLFRGGDYVLPARDIRHVRVAEAEDIAVSGGVAAAAFFLVGYDKDREEAENMEEVAGLARGCSRLSIPLLVQAIPFGPRVTGDNLFDCISMAARMSLEAGADLVAAPHPGKAELMDELAGSVKAPLLLWDRGFEPKVLETRCRGSLDSGAAGMLVGEGIFQSPGWPGLLKRLNALIHG